MTNAKTKSYSWTLEPYQNHGKLWLKWSTDAPFRAQQGQLRVYSGDHFPTDPTHDMQAWTWDTSSETNIWNTRQNWGTGWYCAWIAEKPINGPYTYVIQAITDSDMGPDIAKK